MGGYIHYFARFYRLPLNSWECTPIHIFEFIKRFVPYHQKHNETECPDQNIDKSLKGNFSAIDSCALLSKRELTKSHRQFEGKWQFVSALKISIPSQSTNKVKCSGYSSPANIHRSTDEKSLSLLWNLLSSHNGKLNVCFLLKHNIGHCIVHLNTIGVSKSRYLFCPDMLREGINQEDLACSDSSFLFSYSVCRRTSVLPEWIQ